MASKVSRAVLVFSAGISLALHQGERQRMPPKLHANHTGYRDVDGQADMLTSMQATARAATGTSTEDGDSLCRDARSLTLKRGRVVYSNLGGYGPDFGQPPKILIEGVFPGQQDIFLEISNNSEYFPGPGIMNGLRSCFGDDCVGDISLMPGSAVSLKFQFLVGPVLETQAVGRFYFSIVGLGQGHGDLQLSHYEAYKVSDDTQVQVQPDLTFHSESPPSPSQYQPRAPSSASTMDLQDTVTFTMAATSQFLVRYFAHSDARVSTLAFTGRTSLVCSTTADSLSPTSFTPAAREGIRDRLGSPLLGDGPVRTPSKAPAAMSPSEPVGHLQLPAAAAAFAGRPPDVAEEPVDKLGHEKGGDRIEKVQDEHKHLIETDALGQYCRDHHLLSFAPERLVSSNLAGLGPDVEFPTGIRYADVFPWSKNRIDLNLENVSSYTVKDSGQNGIYSYAGNVGLQAEHEQHTEVHLRFSFFKHHTEIPVMTPPFILSLISVSRLRDVRLSKFEAFYRHEDSDIESLQNRTFRSRVKHEHKTRFVDPWHMPEDALKDSISFTMPPCSHFWVTFSVERGAQRSLTFAGATNLICSPSSRSSKHADLEPRQREHGQDQRDWPTPEATTLSTTTDAPVSTATTSTTKETTTFSNTTDTTVSTATASTTTGLHMPETTTLSTTSAAPVSTATTSTTKGLPMPETIAPSTTTAALVSTATTSTTTGLPMPETIAPSTTTAAPVSTATTSTTTATTTRSTTTDALVSTATPSTTKETTKLSTTNDIPVSTATTSTTTVAGVDTQPQTVTPLEDEGAFEAERSSTRTALCEDLERTLIFSPEGLNHSNMGGLGPDLEAPQGILYRDVFPHSSRVVDLQLTNATEYQPFNTDLNGLSGVRVNLNQRAGTETKFNFIFVDAETRMETSVGPFFITITHFTGLVNHSELARIRVSDYVSYSVLPDSGQMVDEVNNFFVGPSTEEFVQEPPLPMHYPQAVLRNAIALQLPLTSHFEVTLMAPKEGPAMNLAIAGRSNLNCGFAAAKELSTKQVTTVPPPLPTLETLPPFSAGTAEPTTTDGPTTTRLELGVTTPPPPLPTLDTLPPLSGGTAERTTTTDGPTTTGKAATNPSIPTTMETTTEIYATTSIPTMDQPHDVPPFEHSSGSTAQSSSTTFSVTPIESAVPHSTDSVSSPSVSASGSTTHSINPSNDDLPDGEEGTGAATPVVYSNTTTEDFSPLTGQATNGTTTPSSEVTFGIDVRSSTFSTSSPPSPAAHKASLDATTSSAGLTTLETVDYMLDAFTTTDAQTPPSDNDPKCSEQTSLHFSVGSIIHSNLGGAGPDVDAPPTILIADVFPGTGEKIYLEVANLTEYHPSDANKNGLHGFESGSEEDSGFHMSVNVRPDSAVHLWFRFLRASTGLPATLGPFYLSMLQVFRAIGGSSAPTIVVPGCDGHQLSNESHIIVSDQVPCTFGTSATEWNSGDVGDSLLLSEEEQKDALSVEMPQQSDFVIQLQVGEGKEGHNFLFAGQTPFACPRRAWQFSAMRSLGTLAHSNATQNVGEAQLASL